MVLRRWPRQYFVIRLPLTVVTELHTGAGSPKEPLTHAFPESKRGGRPAPLLLLLPCCVLLPSRGLDVGHRWGERMVTACWAKMANASIWMTKSASDVVSWRALDPDLAPDRASRGRLSERPG